MPLLVLPIVSESSKGFRKLSIRENKLLYIISLYSFILILLLLQIKGLRLSPVKHVHIIILTITSQGLQLNATLLEYFNIDQVHLTLPIDH